MISTDAVAVALAAADGVIDKMELATDVFDVKERAWLAMYQLELAARTPGDHDNTFVKYLQKYMIAHWERDNTA